MNQNILSNPTLKEYHKTSRCISMTVLQIAPRIMLLAGLGLVTRLTPPRSGSLGRGLPINHHEKKQAKNSFLAISTFLWQHFTSKISVHREVMTGAPTLLHVHCSCTVNPTRGLADRIRHPVHDGHGAAGGNDPK